MQSCQLPLWAWLRVWHSPGLSVVSLLLGEVVVSGRTRTIPSESPYKRTSDVLWAIIAGVACAAVLTALLSLVFGDSPAWRYDLDVYRSGVLEVVHGRPLYSNDLGFTYPPFGALLLSWLVAVPSAAAPLVLVFLSIACLEVSIWLLLAARNWPSRRYRVVAMVLFTAGLVWTDPARTSLMLGQVTFLILVVTVLDLTRSDRSRLKGLGIGLMTGLKLVPGIFIVYFAVTRRWRATAMSALVFGATIAVGLAVLPGDSVGYWTDYLFDSSRIGQAQDVYSESVQSVIVRWTGSYDGVMVPSVLLSTAVVVLGFWIARRAHDRGEALLAYAACGVVVVLALPIAWTFYWLWPLVPLAVRLVELVVVERSRVAAGCLAVLAVVFYTSPNSLAASKMDGGELQMSVGEKLATSTHLAAALAVLGTVFLVTRISVRNAD